MNCGGNTDHHVRVVGGSHENGIRNSHDGRPSAAEAKAAVPIAAETAATPASPVAPASAIPSSAAAKEAWVCSQAPAIVAKSSEANLGDAVPSPRCRWGLMDGSHVHRSDMDRSGVDRRLLGHCRSSRYPPDCRKKCKNPPGAKHVASFHSTPPLRGAGSLYRLASRRVEGKSNRPQ